MRKIGMLGIDARIQDSRPDRGAEVVSNFLQLLTFQVNHERYGPGQFNGMIRFRFQTR